ncbi:hypothetical protein [Moorena sp. SIO4E2]|uniref:hypothetical protein n=1 Tax=Moorena sp. SIO4E2 TaxID=2607826 RepID=UPI0025802DAD|nr:hypothetical protein [Moorena sp. SIO4E2]
MQRGLGGFPHERLHQDRVLTPWRLGLWRLCLSYQLSAISYQLSAISYQLSAIIYQLMG